MTGHLPLLKIRAEGIESASTMQQLLLREMYRIDSAVESSSSAEAISIDYKTVPASSESAEAASLFISKELRKKLRKVVGLSTEDVEMKHRMESYGVDSLVSFELRNWFYREMGGGDITHHF